MTKRREYYITDGENFVKQSIESNKYVFTSNFAIADVWDSPNVAEAVLNNSLPKTMSIKCYVAYYDNGMLCKYKLTQAEKKERRDRITAPNKEGKSYVLEQYSFDSDIDVLSLIEGFESVKNAFEYAHNEYRRVEECLTRLNYMDEDIKHYLGRRKINARDGYKLTKARQDIVLKRISLKNQLEIIKTLNDKYYSLIDDIRDVCDVINDIKTRVYKPRVLIELFERDRIDINVIDSAL